jgi:hypothetical protein
MADECDRSDQRIADAIERGILQARSAPALRPKGRCHFCDEPAEAPLLFCDMDCSHDFSNEEEAIKRAGR